VGFKAPPSRRCILLHLPHPSCRACRMDCLAFHCKQQVGHVSAQQHGLQDVLSAYTGVMMHHLPLLLNATATCAAARSSSCTVLVSMSGRPTAHSGCVVQCCGTNPTRAAVSQSCCVPWRMPVPACRNKAGQTPLHIAVAQSKRKVSSFLLAKGADINAKDKFGQTPLMVAFVSAGRRASAGEGWHGACRLLTMHAPCIHGCHWLCTLMLGW
jgi:hypothetical protein